MERNRVKERDEIKQRSYKFVRWLGDAYVKSQDRFYELSKSNRFYGGESPLKILEDFAVRHPAGGMASLPNEFVLEVAIEVRDRAQSIVDELAGFLRRDLADRVAAEQVLLGKMEALLELARPRSLTRELVREANPDAICGMCEDEGRAPAVRDSIATGTLYERAQRPDLSGFEQVAFAPTPGSGPLAGEIARALNDQLPDPADLHENGNGEDSGQPF